MTDQTFERVYRDELQDLYDAERQIVEALPEMIEAASSEELKSAFEDHLEVTKQQLERLEKIFSGMGETPGARKCEGMRGLLAEGRMRIRELGSSEVADAALIAAAQKVEHYEISGYGTVRSLAEMLEQEDAAELLQETLDEEEEADLALTEIAESIMGGDDLEDMEEDEELEEEDDGRKAS
jgi:ferritin-like metal-binding protein YciE